MLRITIIVFISLLFTSLDVYSKDNVILRRAPGLKALPTSYTMQILKASLDATEDRFGPYTLRFSDREMTRSRTFNEMQIRTRVNIADTPISEQWTKEFIRIPIPIKRGILSFRLFFVTKENEDILANIDTIEELKALRQGSGNQWTVTNMLKRHGFNVVTGPQKTR